MKTCAACGRPLASHGGKAAIQSSEIGPKAADASCCSPPGTLTGDSPKSAQGKTIGIKRPVSKPKGAKGQAVKRKIRALREFARKKLGHFLPARITLRRPKVEETPSEAPRLRRRAVRRFRPKRRHAKSQHVDSKPVERIETPSPSEAATDSGEQAPQTPPGEAVLEQRTEESKHLIAASAEQVELSFPNEARFGAGEQSFRAYASEMQLANRTEESERVVATSAEQLELLFSSEAITGAGEQSPQAQAVEAPLEKGTEESEHAIATPENIEPASPSEATADAAEQSSQTPLAEPEPDESAEASAIDTTLFENEELVFLPWRADEPLEVPALTAEAPGVEEQAKAPAESAAEVCNKPEEPHIEQSNSASAQCNEAPPVGKPAENPKPFETPVEKIAPEGAGNVPFALSISARADEPPDITPPAPEKPALEEKAPTPPAALVEKAVPAAYAMIPPAPSAPVPRREEFEAKPQTKPGMQNKESLVEESSVELLPGLIEAGDMAASGQKADSATQCETATEKPMEVDDASHNTEEAAGETESTLFSVPPEELPALDFPNPLKPETHAAMPTNLENCVEQTSAPESEMEIATDTGGLDEKAETAFEQPPRKKVLVVDDDPTLRMLLRMGLEPQGYECLLAENGKAAQAVVQANHPALILVDLLMPVMDGLAFVQWLRGTAKDSTPVLVFTNLDDAKVTQQALDSGANAFACKPLRLKELLQTMKELVPA